MHLDDSGPSELSSVGDAHRHVHRSNDLFGGGGSALSFWIVSDILLYSSL